jgi:hypothetical protein
MAFIADQVHALLPHRRQDVGRRAKGDSKFCFHPVLEKRALEHLVAVGVTAQFLEAVVLQRTRIPVHELRPTERPVHGDGLVAVGENLFVRRADLRRLRSQRVRQFAHQPLLFLTGGRTAQLKRHCLGQQGRGFLLRQGLILLEQLLLQLGLARLLNQIEQHRPPRSAQLLGLICR